MSLALWPIANTTIFVSIVSSSLTITDFIFEPSMLIWVTLESNLTVPPSLLISSLIFFTTLFNISVPTWGLFEYKISSGAPKFTNSVKTFLHLMSLILVVNFPSEKVPAPPSPNWTLELFLNFLSTQKLSISFVLLSTSRPLSSIIGIYPLCAKTKDANNPAGPLPITTGLC